MSATGIGSMPGDDQAAFDEALRVILGELGPDSGPGGQLPFLPEVPGRGASAAMTGRSLAVLDALAVDLQPAGWRLTGGPGVGLDQRRARSLLAQDLDTLEEQAEGLTGAFKVQLVGPWTLAATVEKPRGDKVLSDHGARRELAQGLAEGVRGHVRDVRRRLPGVERLVVQVDEPALAATLAGSVPTASGFGRHRVVRPPEASEHLGWVFEAIAEAGAEPWVHACSDDVPVALLRGAGTRGVAVDLGRVGAAGHDALAEALEAGDTVVFGVVPSTDPSAAEVGSLSDAALTERVLRWLDVVGLDPEALAGQVHVSPACGLAGATPAWARRALELSVAVAGHLAVR